MRTALQVLPLELHGCGANQLRLRGALAARDCMLFAPIAPAHLPGEGMGCVEREDAMGIAVKADTLREIEQTFGQVPTWIKQLPDTALGGFWGLFRDFYLAETVIPNKYKELIGLAVSGATRCRYCALFHTEAARLHGATEAEIAEASMMSGVTMCGSTFLNAQLPDYEEFRRETEQIVAFVKKQGQKKPEARAPVARA
jgi:AhpD family alkylhydroperoxidase